MSTIAVVATCNLNQWAMDFTGNLERIRQSIAEAKVPCFSCALMLDPQSVAAMPRWRKRRFIALRVPSKVYARWHDLLDGRCCRCRRRASER